MNPENIQKSVTWAFGLLAAAVFLAMAWASLDPTITISPPVIIGMLALTYLLLHGADRTTELLAIWRGSSLSNNDNSNDRSNRRGDDDSGGRE